MSETNKEYQAEKKYPYSENSFLFPFIFGVDKFSEVDSLYKNISTYLDNNDWEPIFYNKLANNPNYTRKIYDAYKYFHKSATDLLYPNDSNSIVKQFEYKKEQIDNNELKININKELDILHNFTLSITGITLSFYKTGVGILCIDLENTSHSDIDDVLKINEYFRRLYPPYLTVDNKSNKLIADEIVLLEKDKPIFTANTFNYLSSIADQCNPNKNFSQITHIVNHLLGNKIVFSEENNNYNLLSCKTLDDDRMFVVSSFTNKEMVSTLNQWDGSNYAYQLDSFKKNNPDIGFVNKKHLENTINKLYEYVFIDGDGLTCQDRQMKIKLLGDHLYTRWIDYGSIYGVTQHSMVLLANDDFPCHAFKNLYKNMAILVLTQRASIISMDEQTSKLVKEIDDSVNLNDTLIEKIRKLQENYIILLNQILSFEPTGQEQGIEIYEMLQRFMFIKEEHGHIEKQIKSLYEMSIVASNSKKQKQDGRRNLILFVIAILSFIKEFIFLFNYILVFFKTYPHALIIAIILLFSCFIFKPRNYIMDTIKKIKNKITKFIKKIT